MDGVPRRRETVVIAKRDQAGAKLVAIGPEDDEILHFLRGPGVSVGDVVGPALWAKKWGHRK
jgi:hypothetical protein